MKGKTIKQIDLDEFHAALAAYKESLRTGVDLVSASIRVHVAKGRVPKSCWPLVRRAMLDVRDEKLAVKCNREIKLVRALRETTERLSELIKGEKDDETVGITGWDGMHQLVDDNRKLLETCP